MAGEAPVTLYLPGSIVVTSGLDWAGLKGGAWPAEQYPRLVKFRGLTLSSRSLPALAESHCYLTSIL